jgi:ankyrin repeat protein
MKKILSKLISNKKSNRSMNPDEEAKQIEILIVAAENDDLSQVKQALATGININSITSNSSALHCAVFNGHSEIIEFLLSKNADINLKDQQNFTPIQLAVSKKEKEICNVLIRNGADINVVTKKKGTLLHLAAANDFILFFDLDKIDKIDIELKDYEGKSALNVASSLGNYDMIDELLSKNADVNSADDNGMTPFINSLRYATDKRIEFWESEGYNDDVRVRYEIINSWFRYIKPYQGNEEELGEDLPIYKQESIANLSWTPEGLKEYLEALLICEELFVERDDINKSHKDILGNDVGIYVCSLGDPNIIYSLAENNYSLTTSNNEGIKPLHYLARGKRLDGLKVYLRVVKGYDINCVDNNGWTSGHFLADQGGHPAIARLLIEKGLDSTITSTQEFATFPEGTLAKDVALHWKDDKMFQLLS